MGFSFISQKVLGKVWDKCGKYVIRYICKQVETKLLKGANNENRTNIRKENRKH